MKFNVHVSSFLQVERLAKRLKKEKVHIDVVSFGEEVGRNYGGTSKYDPLVTLE